MIDERWETALLGLIVRLNANTLDGKLHAGRRGEVTGYDHHRHHYGSGVVWVVFDGEDEPRGMAWDEVRPA